jgi:bacteriocin biosynthesis cyclodehydratase domain-containing protein
MTRRLVLLPGLRAIPSGTDEIHIGPGATAVLRVPATAPVRRALAAIDRGEMPPTDPPGRAALRLLAPVLVDADVLSPPELDGGDVAALAAGDPVRLSPRLRARRAMPTAVVGSLGIDPVPLLLAAGLVVVDQADEPRSVLVPGYGEIDREETDHWLHAGCAHLPVRALGARIVLGPLVVPGRTACLRCLECHRTAADPRYPLLLGRHLAAVRHDGVAAPRDSALAALALGWAVRDLVSLAEGGRPATWSTTIELGPDLDRIARTPWLRHPGCSCSWATDLDAHVSDTMGP